jgi:hypothetical protein
MVYNMFMKATKELIIATTSASEGLIAKQLLERKGRSGWKTETRPWRKFRSRSYLPDITVVDLGHRSISGASFKDLLRELALKQRATAEPAFIVLVFSSVKRPAPDKLTELLRPFPKPERVEITWNASPDKVDEIVVAIEPKLEVLREAAASTPNPPRSSQMDRIEKVLAATRDLRSENGNLSARNIAKLYGISLSELGKWINRSRQALNKTPDAESIQNTLGYFERIARLRLRLSNDDFRKWLRMPNSLLEGIRPLDLLAQQRWQELSDFVDDLLTGSPT